MVHQVCPDAEYHSADEVVPTRQPNKCKEVARAQARLVMVARAGRLRGWKRGLLLRTLDEMGVKVPKGRTRNQCFDVAIKYALPLLAEYDEFVTETDRITRSAAPPSSSQFYSQDPFDDMAGLIDE